MAYTKRKRSYASYRRGGSSRPYRRYNYKRSTVPRRRISGRGDYKTWWGNVKKRWFRPYTGKLAGVGSAIGGAAGNVIAPGIGGTIGGGLGGLAGMAVDRVMGWGDYTIKKNSLAIQSAAESVPVFGKGEIRVRHKEYIGTILSSEGFQTGRFFLNPGLGSTFPWLAEIAKNFEQYEWKGMIFQFMSSSGQAVTGTNPSLGQVIMATDYNAADSEYISKAQMLGTEFSNMGKPAENIMHAIECAPAEQAMKKYWVRTGGVPTGQDPKTYDLGFFQLAVLGCPADGDVIGDLWVTYDVVLSKPVQNNVIGSALPINHYALSGVSSAAPFGTNWKAELDNIEDLTINGTQIMLPPNDSVGSYMIIYNIQGTAAVLNDPTVGLNASCQPKGLWNNTATNFITNGVGGVTDDCFFYMFGVQCVGERAVITFANDGAYPTSINYADLVIIQVPYYWY